MQQCLNNENGRYISQSRISYPERILKLELLVHFLITQEIFLYNGWLNSTLNTYDFQYLINFLSFLRMQVLNNLT